MPTIGNIALSGRRGETARILYKRKQWQRAREEAERRVEESRAAAAKGDREVEVLARERAKEHPPGYTSEGYRAKLRAQHGPSWWKRIWSERSAEIREQAAVNAEQAKQEEANRMAEAMEQKHRGIVAKLKYLLAKRKRP